MNDFVLKMVDKNNGKDVSIEMTATTENAVLVEATIMNAFQFMGVEHLYNPFVEVAEWQKDVGEQLTKVYSEMAEVYEKEPLEPPLKEKKAEEKKPIEPPVVWNKTDGKTLEKRFNGRAKQLPLMSGAINTFPMGDMAKITPIQEESKKLDEEVDPKHWKTGIKEKDGEQMYKTRYECTECGEKGTRYLEEREGICECHKCGVALLKESATEQGFPHQDAWGNFFFARELF